MRKNKIVAIIIIFSLFSHTVNCQDTTGLTSYNQGVQFLYTNFDSSIFYFQQGIEFLEQDLKNFETYIDCYNGLFAANWLKGVFEDAEKAILTGYDKAELHLNKSSSVYSDLLNNLGFFYSTKGSEKKAISFYSESLSTRKLEKDKITALGNIATAFSNLKDYSNSISYIEKVLTILEQNNDISNEKREMIYGIVGKIYLNKNDYDKAIVFFKKSLILLEKFEQSNYTLDSKVVNLNYISKALLGLEKVKDAKYYLDNALKIHRNPNIQFKNLSYNTLGKIKENKNLLKEAKKAYQTAIRAIHVQLSEFKHYDVIAWEYTDLAALELKMNDLDSALHTIHTAVSYFAKDVDRDKPLTTPKVEDFVYRGKILRTLTLKAQILQALYQESNDQKELQAAFDTYQLAAELAKLMRQDIMTQGSKQKLAGEVLPIYEGGIETTLALFELTGEALYKDAAFQFAESNKAILLLESMNDNDAKNYSGIPDSLLEKDNELRIEIAFYEKNISQEQSKKENIDQDKIKQWESTLFDLNAEYQSLIELLEKDYPKYVDIKYNTKLATPQELQSNLIGAKDALLEYFIGEENIYAFLITKDHYEVITIDKPENFQKNIDLFLFHTKRPSKSDTDFRLVLETQHDYYIKYVQSAISKLPEQINRLVIIPDDVFNYIPFEIFITSPIPSTDVPFSPKKHDYLFEEYIMTYNYSATLFQKSFEVSKKEKADKMLLAMAPEFNKNAIALTIPTQRACTIFDIYDLACSGQEVKEIATQMKGDYFVGFDADKNTFEQMAKNYRILHLATHSCPDENNPNFSKIFLSDEAITNYDLLNYEFNADLAVLSACNTGFGKLVKGEGVMPLSKGFIQAGIPSTVMSLWPVDDCGTSKIMKLFYKYLDQGLPKDEALQKAKLEFIDISNMVYQHPYYWSAFIHMGNFEPIHEKSKIPPIVWWIGGALLALGIFQFSRKKLAKAA